MNHCSACRWWVPQKPNGWGICELTRSEGSVYDATFRNSPAVAVSIGYRPSVLRTRPTFGCVSFEAPEVTNGSNTRSD